ncbi:hypothetical protein FE257_000778 [Aspergillus nanangensis]|uniref:FAD-binding domain-containing protein n=1 Tax=Aspergillus nanangensis TaxID=2582783 RepID=A0AAD4CG49_ASPNN|nr:hypothetical protein FE257_000778 [Aspergillus nanangensis]
MSATFRIIIVGGGIAGLAAAVALRDKQREITVFEQASQLNEIGAGISLQPNASKIVEDWWGLKDALQQRKSAVDQGARVVYHRQDLQDVLREAATGTDRPGCPVMIRTSSRVISCDVDAGAVTLDDGSTATADLVIAADGIKSKMRRFVLGRDQNAIPTGISAYRFMIPMEELEAIAEFTQFINPRDEYTTMVLCHDHRLVMGPVRKGEAYSVVALVPDETLHEDSSSTSWTSHGEKSKMLGSFSDLPEWLLKPFRNVSSLGLWQLRDLEPLETWINGRCILIGDAAHAMLPTQGQGASQAIEDAEALSAFFQDIQCRPSPHDVHCRLQDAFASRHDRATLIQQYSRQQAKPATEKDSVKIKMDPEEFTSFNYTYNGAKDWLSKVQSKVQRSNNA